MKSLVGLVVVVIVALWSVWPCLPAGRLWGNWEKVADYGKDGMLIATIQMNWQRKISDLIRKCLEPGMGLFDGYFLYAEKNTLAFSDMFTVSALMTYWPSVWMQQPAAGVGMTLVFSQVLGMVVTYALFARKSKSVWGGMIGSIAFGLSQIHFMYQVHLQMFNVVIWLVSYWLFSRKKYFLSAVFLGLQFWESPLGTYFGVTMIFLHLIIGSFDHKFKHLLIFSFTLTIIAYLPVRAYWEVSKYYGYTRSIRDAAHHAISLNDIDGFWSIGLFILFVYSINRLNSKFKILNHELSARSTRKQILASPTLREQNPNIKFLISLILVSYVLALGPILKWSGKTVKFGGVVPIPLPYAAAYYLVPGWQAFRVPSRWLVLTGLGMAGTIAIGFSHLTFKHLSFNKIVGLFGLFTIAILGGTRLTKYVDLPKEIPKEYLVDREILEFKPMGDEGAEIERMYFSILAGKKTLNGYSGFVPPSRVQLLNEK